MDSVTEKLALDLEVGATQALADFVASMRTQAVPAAVRTVLQDAVVDAIGCGLYGLTTEPVRIIHEFALEQAGPPEVTLWASGGRKISALNAALAMGTAIHGFDFDDHSRAKIHPGAAVLPAALALAEREGADGSTFLTALAVGYEVMTRVSLAANPNSSRMRGWHLTGTCGTFGAAAAAAVILGLNASETASALGLAGTQSAGLWAFNADGAMSKRLHPGVAAQSGIRAALLAQKGFHGPRMILETEDGGFLQATSDDVRLGEITRGLGSEWRTEGVCFKPYACCGSNHSSIDAVLELMHEHGFVAADVERVVLGVSHVVERQTGFVYRPTTVLNAQMSIRYDVAVAILDGQALLEQFTLERVVDVTVCDLASRVEVVIDAEMDRVYPEIYAGIANVHLRDGRSFQRRVDYSRGMPENRMAPAEMQQKYLSLARTGVGEDGAALLEDLSAIFEAQSLAPIAAKLGGLSVTAPMRAQGLPETT